MYSWRLTDGEKTHILEREFPAVVYLHGEQVLQHCVQEELVSISLVDLDQLLLEQGITQEQLSYKWDWSQQHKVFFY